jgi:hypothetical protein
MPATGGYVSREGTAVGEWRFSRETDELVRFLGREFDTRVWRGKNESGQEELKTPDCLTLQYGTDKLSQNISN